MNIVHTWPLEWMGCCLQYIFQNIDNIFQLGGVHVTLHTFYEYSSYLAARWSGVLPPISIWSRSRPASTISLPNQFTIPSYNTKKQLNNIKIRILSDANYIKICSYLIRENKIFIGGFRCKNWNAKNTTMYCYI